MSKTENHEDKGVTCHFTPCDLIIGSECHSCKYRILYIVLWYLPFRSSPHTLLCKPGLTLTIVLSVILKNLSETI